MIRRLPNPLMFLAMALSFAMIAPRDSAAQTLEMETGSPVLLTVSTLVPERVVLQEELPGRVAALQRVEIRPQVGGLILDRLVNEGARVEAGDVLFRINPAPLQADLATAEAALARAVAAEAFSRRSVERSDALLGKNAVSREKNDTAHNELVLAAANSAEARALVDRRRLDLEFATLSAPISGYVTGGLVDIGGLAAPGADKPLAVIQELDRVYVDLRLPVARLDAILIAAEEGLGPVDILTDRDQTYLQPGQLKFPDVVVDPGTGNVSVRVEVANPDLALLPGMFVRARLPRGLLPDALLVPEDAILRNGAGVTQIVVVSAQAEAMRREVTLGDTIGGRVVVTSGLKAGEVIAILGQDRVPDGMKVKVASDSADAAL
ncbi:efflux RND transporter periplasmic adaptor subunit [Pseudotabrizicola alkalilacus]|uniref:Efflux RND transporter periplasmic adaptor subunit n=2 Tax=Pseudotabrizicola alkalilacus TaxID=2305252 RepID=A0A411YXA3_9RHOB|nr:efflux RND transporter periplasmic adaptor subunit [Pseudotabrizicola alkalilacus]